MSETLLSRLAAMANPLCGCIPMAGGGVIKRCAEALCLWACYLVAMERDPANLTAYRDAWADYCAHIGQEAWA